jgi:competence protein ComEC
VSQKRVVRGEEQAMASLRWGLTSRSIEAVKAVSMTGILLSLRNRWWAFAEAERQSLALWLPVAFAAGVALWFIVPWQSQRWALALAFGGIGAASLLQRWRPLAAVALLVLAGMAAAEWRSARVAAPVLDHRQIATVTGSIESIENRRDRTQLRMLVAVDANHGLPPRIRLTVKGDPPPGLAPGARLRVRALLSPPSGAAVPGGYDFARRAWFAGIGATGFPMGRISVIAPAPPPSGALARLDAVRSR